MRTPLVAGNWKMHGSSEFVADHVKQLAHAGLPASVEVALFPPFVYLGSTEQAIKKAGLNLQLGAQNLHAEAEGAFTGEVAGPMLRDSGCRYVLVGHSERRALFDESDSVVADKFAAALEAELVPVLCVGETLKEREADATLEVVGAQLGAVIERVGLEAVCQAVIAYEPVWAIGTGRTASPAQAQEVHAALRRMLGEGGAKTRILYGGSVKADNAGELFRQADIDGGLVGGASLDANTFVAICNQAEQH